MVIYRAGLEKVHTETASLQARPRQKLDRARLAYWGVSMLPIIRRESTASTTVVDGRSSEAGWRDAGFFMAPPS